MLRNTMYVKFVLPMLVLGTLAVLVGGDPWGPN
jgi:hypothetical protein